MDTRETIGTRKTRETMLELVVAMEKERTIMRGQSVQE